MEKLTLPERESLRNLVQYRDLSDDEFEKRYKQLCARKEKEYLEKLNAPKIVPNSKSELDVRIEEKRREFEDAYDLSDLKFNDIETLRALVRALISLEDIENDISALQEEGTNSANINYFQKLNAIASTVRQDISKLQDDLKITRKIRKSDKEASVIRVIDDLKEKALKFYRQKMSYIFCPECRMLLGTAWFLYPEEDNIIRLTCNRELENGEKCGHVVVVNTKELIENGNTNCPEAMPELL